MKPLAQKYVVITELPKHLRCECEYCRKKGEHSLIIDDVSLTRTPGNALLAVCTYNPDAAGRHPRKGGEISVQWSNPERFRIFRSHDEGETWKELPPLEINAARPFVHGNKLYLLGNALGRRDIIITSSDDEGENWEEPLTIYKGFYWNTPAGMAIRDGKLYYAFGTPDPETGKWNSVAVVAGDLSALMELESWRISNVVKYPGTPEQLNILKGRKKEGDHWLEGSMVNVAGNIRLLMRCRMSGGIPIAGVCDLEDDGNKLNLEFSYFYPVSGSQMKMHIIFDEVSGYFWSAVNLITDNYDAEKWWKKACEKGFAGNPSEQRHLLMLQYSVDALNWIHAGCVCMGNSVMEGYQYSVPIVSGNDMLIAVRTSPPGNKNQHDATLVTLHKVKKFRELALDIHSGI